jgi:8-oxo-dGTP diphosphatase
MRVVPQFGQPEPGLEYPDRPAAFAIVARPGGEIATVRVDYPDGEVRIDLPGGGIDAGEDAEIAAVRECGEEAGLRVAVTREIARADHFFLNQQDRPVNTRGVFFEARLLAEDPSLKVEGDHTLVWMRAEEALMRLSRESHVWALVSWLRARA